jgi:TP901 family phage tail tape measure protein
VRTVKVVIEASVAGAIANVKAFKGTIADLGSELDRAASKHPERLNKISNATGALGLGMAVAFGAVVKTTMDFDKQMSHAAAVADGGAKSLNALRQAALAAGRDTAYTATQAGQAEEELAKAGISTADILGGALTGALNLAAAGDIELADAATIAAQAMTEFGLKGKDVPHIADVLASAANASAADVSGLGMALGQVGGVAHQTGLTLEDTAGTLADFTQQGMNGEEAGTTLKQMLLQLQAPSKESADLMQHLGINIYDAQGHFIGITGVAQNLHDTLGNLTEAERNAALGTIFGSRAIRGATVLYQQGAVGLQDWIDKSNQAGAAGDTAAQKLDNLSGDLHKLLGSLQAVAIDGAGGATSGLRDMTGAVTDAVNWFGSLPKPVSETVTVLLGVGAAGLLATSGLLKVKTTVTGAMDALRGIGPVGEKAASTLGKIGSVGGKLGLAGIVVFGLYEAFNALSEWTDKKSAPVARDIDMMASSLKQFALDGQAAGEMAKAFGPDLAGLGKDMDTVSHSQAALAEAQKKYNASVAIGHGIGNPQAKDPTEKAIRDAKSDITALDTALAQVAKNGGATQAKMAFDKITESLLAQGKPLAEINKMFPQYATAASDAAAATTGVAQGFGTLASNSSLLTKGLQDAIDHGESLTDVFKQLNGAALDLLGAQINEEQSLADLKEKWDKHGNSLKLDTQAGRDNLKMIKDSIEGAAQAAQAKYNETGSVQQATDTYNSYIAKLRQTLHSLGLNDEAINKIINDYGQMPAAVTTQVNTPGLQTAVDRASRVNNELDRIDGRNATASVNVNVRSSQLDHVLNQLERLPGGFGNRMGGLYEHAAVGTLRDAALYSPVNPGRYMIAEPATHGEAFIPKSGNLSRSRAIADYVVGNWLGGSTDWGRGHGGGGGGVAHLVHTFEFVSGGVSRPLSQAMSSWFMGAVRDGEIKVKSSQLLVP